MGKGSTQKVWISGILLYKEGEFSIPGNRMDDQQIQDLAQWVGTFTGQPVTGPDDAFSATMNERVQEALKSKTELSWEVSLLFSHEFGWSCNLTVDGRDPVYSNHENQYIAFALAVQKAVSQLN